MSATARSTAAFATGAADARSAHHSLGRVTRAEERRTAGSQSHRVHGTNDPRRFGSFPTTAPVVLDVRSMASRELTMNELSGLSGLRGSAPRRRRPHDSCAPRGRSPRCVRARLVAETGGRGDCQRVRAPAMTTESPSMKRRGRGPSGRAAARSFVTRSSTPATTRSGASPTTSSRRARGRRRSADHGGEAPLREDGPGPRRRARRKPKSPSTGGSDLPHRESHVATPVLPRTTQRTPCPTRRRALVGQEGKDLVPARCRARSSGLRFSSMPASERRSSRAGSSATSRSRGSPRTAPSGRERGGREGGSYAFGSRRRASRAKPRSWPRVVACMSLDDASGARSCDGGRARPSMECLARSPMAVRRPLGT